MINTWTLDNWKLSFGVLQPGEVRGRLRGEGVHKTWMILGMNAENFDVWKDLGVCLSQITSLGEGKRVLYADLANSFYVRRRPVEKKIGSQRKVKEHFLTSDNNNLSGSSCSCVGRKEHLLVVQEIRMQKWLLAGQVLAPEDPHTVFPSFTQVRCRICSKIWFEIMPLQSVPACSLKVVVAPSALKWWFVSLKHLRTHPSPCPRTSVSPWSAIGLANPHFKAC